MAKKPRYDVLSPDGFSIHPFKTYPSKEKALDAFEKWKQRYEAQGYYSSNFRRIYLHDLINHCKIVELNNN